MTIPVFGGGESLLYIKGRAYTEAGTPGRVQSALDQTEFGHVRSWGRRVETGEREVQGAAARRLRVQRVDNQTGPDVSWQVGSQIKDRLAVEPRELVLNDFYFDWLTDFVCMHMSTWVPNGSQQTTCRTQFLPCVSPGNQTQIAHLSSRHLYYLSSFANLS